MKQDSKRLSSVLFAGFLLIAAILVYFELIVPAYGQLQIDKGQDLSEKALYSNEKQIVTQVQALLSTYQNQSAANQSVALALPVGQNTADAIAQVYGIATNAGLSIRSMGIAVQAVQATAVANSTVPTSGQIANAAAGGGSIVEPTGTVSLQVTGTGSYESFKTFLQGLETNIRIFDVTAVSIEPAINSTVQPVVTTKGQTVQTNQVTQANSQDMFNYTLTAVTYYQAQ
jgi:Tfp pilus assembly protein PilO